MRRRGDKRSRVSAVGSLIEEGLAGLQIANKIREHTAPLVWAEVVGPQVAGATEVIGIRDGVLIVSTKSAVWSHELTFYKADILRRLNSRIGAPAGPSRDGAIKELMLDTLTAAERRNGEMAAAARK